MDSSHPFVVRYKYVQIKKKGVVVTLFCALCMFIKAISDAHSLRFHHVINEYTDLILEITD